ncbi:MAG: hypothetical protein AVDCRST_MAG49-4153, partial [uncultured Thermomicrobiales bacterium]
AAPWPRDRPVAVGPPRRGPGRRSVPPGRARFETAPGASPHLGRLPPPAGGGMLGAGLRPPGRRRTPVRGRARRGPRSAPRPITADPERPGPRGAPPSSRTGDVRHGRPAAM